MDIYPQDLGEARRARLTQPPKRSKAATPLIFVAGGVWLLISCHILSLTSPFWLGVIVFFVVRRLPSLPSLQDVQHKVRGGQGVPLTPPDVQRLKAACRDSLEQDYLGLVLAAVQMPKRPEALAQSEIREAIRALGAALDHVPTKSKAHTDSAHDLAVSAAGLAVDADRETDPVVAGSLRRRADARRQQAETVALLETQARRGAALRAELSDEIASLQASLTVLGAQGVWSVQEMADVAAGIGWIAIKAQGLAAAQAEMDAALHVHTLPAPLHDGPDGTRQRLSRYMGDNTRA